MPDLPYRWNTTRRLLVWVQLQDAEETRSRGQVQRACPWYWPWWCLTDDPVPRSASMRSNSWGLITCRLYNTPRTNYMLSLPLCSFSPPRPTILVYHCYVRECHVNVTSMWIHLIVVLLRNTRRAPECGVSIFENDAKQAAGAGVQGGGTRGFGAAG